MSQVLRNGRTRRSLALPTPESTEPLPQHAPSEWPGEEARSGCCGELPRDVCARRGKLGSNAKNRRRRARAGGRATSEHFSASFPLISSELPILSPPRPERVCIRFNRLTSILSFSLKNKYTNNVKRSPFAFAPKDRAWKTENALGTVYDDAGTLTG